MEIKFQNALQSHIADLMWNAKDMSTINKILSIYGRDAHVVYHMLLAETYDGFDETDIASAVLEKIFRV